MENEENNPELQAEIIENSDLEDENEALYKWLVLSVFVVWIFSFLML